MTRHKIQNEPVSRSIAGFTLIEVLIAITIFSILSIGCYKLLTQQVQASAPIEERSRQLENLQRTTILWKNDVLQAIRYPGASTANKQKHGLQGTNTELSIVNQGRFLTAFGRSNKNQTISFLLKPNKNSNNKVNTLIRTIRYGDKKTEKATQQPLMHKVKNLSFSYLDHRGEWSDQWPVDRKSPNLPNAVSLTLDTGTYGKIKLVTALNSVN